ncbi:hypothetical protein JOM56_005708 [Amanita muscaria]
MSLLSLSLLLCPTLARNPAFGSMPTNGRASILFAAEHMRRQDNTETRSKEVYHLDVPCFDIFVPLGFRRWAMRRLGGKHVQRFYETTRTSPCKICMRFLPFVFNVSFKPSSWGFHSRFEARINYHNGRD